MVANIIEAIVISKYEHNIWLAASSYDAYLVKENENKQTQIRSLFRCVLVFVKVCSNILLSDEGNICTENWIIRIIR